MPGQLPLGCTQHTRIIQNVSVDFPHSTIRVEEDNKENQRKSQSDLGALIDSQKQHEDRRQHKPGQSDQNLNVRIKNSGPEWRPAEGKTDAHAEDHTKDKSPNHFLQRNQEMMVNTVAAQEKTRVRQPTPGAGRKN